MSQCLGAARPWLYRREAEVCCSRTVQRPGEPAQSCVAAYQGKAFLHCKEGQERYTSRHFCSHVQHCCCQTCMHELVGELAATAVLGWLLQTLQNNRHAAFPNLTYRSDGPCRFSIHGSTGTLCVWRSAAPAKQKTHQPSSLRPSCLRSTCAERVHSWR